MFDFNKNFLPVGALTSKPYAFISRPWELETIEFFDIFDSFSSSGKIYIRNLSVMRILPIVGPRLDNNWVSDKFRFCYDGFYKQRLSSPYIFIKGLGLVSVNWHVAVKFLLYNIDNSNTFESVIGRFTPFQDQLALKDFASFYTGTDNYKLALEFSNFDVDFSSNYLQIADNFNLDKNNNFDNIIFVGLNLRLESPVLNLHVRRLVNSFKIRVLTFGSSLNLMYKSRIFNLGSNCSSITNLLLGKTHFSYILINRKNLLLIGGSYLNFDTNLLIKLLNDLSKNLKFLGNSTFSYSTFFPFLSQYSSFELGLNNSFDNIISSKKLSFTNNNFLYLIDSDEWSLDTRLYNFIVYQGHHGDKSSLISDLILPSPLPLETANKYYLNCFGHLKTTNLVFEPFVNLKDPCFVLQYLTAFILSDNFFNFLSTNFYNYFLNWLFLISDLILFNNFDLNNFFSRFNFLTFRQNYNFQLNYNFTYNDNFGIIKNYSYTKKLYNYPIFGSYLSNYYQSDSITRSSNVMALAFTRFKKEYKNFFN